MKEKIIIVKRASIESFKIFIRGLGVIFLIAIILSFTDLPYLAYHWLGFSASSKKEEFKPDVIILLGGCGMPSPDGLIRSYYTAECAAKYPSSEIIIALPYSENKNDSLDQLNLMAHELIIRGIDSLRIKYEPEGFNTHSQVTNISRMYARKLSQTRLLVVTSPEHTYRAVHTFIKAGFLSVSGIPTFEKPIDSDNIQIKEKSKTLQIKNLDLRYNMWSYLQYELLVARELCAIVYYKIKGWM